MAKELRPRVEAGDAATELAATELARTRDAPAGGREASGPRPSSARATELRAVGRFRVDATLGAGGMGDVYRAHDPMLDRAVALKVLRTERSADGAQRLRRVLREARAAAALTHPNTVTIFEVGEADGEVFIAMELLEGEDLRAVLERGDATVEDKLRWLLQAARALAAAHDRGLVHRDVKPENMFVCKDGSLKLLDFGIAKRDDDDGLGGVGGPVDNGIGPSSLRTGVGRRLGTPRYMAPEQHASEATDARTDEYAWGLIALELLTGAHVGVDLETVTGDAIGDARAPEPAGIALLRRLVPELPEAVVLAIGRALEPRKEDRFPSMAPIVTALERRSEPAPTSRDVPAPSGPEASPSPPAPAAPSPPPRRSRSRWVLAGAIAVAALAAVTIARMRPRVIPAVSLAPACRVESRHAVTMGDDDRLAVLPDGAVVVARDIRNGLSLQRETPGGMVPILDNPMFKAIGKSYEDIELGGVRYAGQPAVLVTVRQDDGRGVFLAAWTETGATGTQRIQPVVQGLDVTSFGNGYLAVSTSGTTTTDRVTRPAAVRVYRVGSGAHQDRTIEEADARQPSIAATGDRVGIAYVTPSRGGLRFALLDANLERMGDVLSVTSSNDVPAVAFAGTTPTVFWTHDEAGKTRLTMASLPPGAAAFTAPRVVSDEPLLDRAPLAVALPNGGWAVAWLATSAAGATLRVSPIGPGGVLTGPSDVSGVAQRAGATNVRATATAAGIDFYWSEAPGTMQIARVTCAAPELQR